MESLLTILFVLVLFYYVSKLFFRYVLPWWLARYMRKQQDRFRQGFYQERKVNSDEKIRYSEKSVQGAVNPDVGEYVDYEEIDDEDNKKK